MRGASSTREVQAKLDPPRATSESLKASRGPTIATFIGRGVRKLAFRRSHAHIDEIGAAFVPSMMPIRCWHIFAAPAAPGQVTVVMITVCATSIGQQQQQTNLTN